MKIKQVKYLIASITVLLATSGCEEEVKVKEFTLHRYCLGYDGIYITDKTMAGRCCAQGALKIGRMGGASGTSFTDVGALDEASENERAFIETGNVIHDAIGSSAGDYVVFYRAKEFPAYKSSGCPMPPELSGVYNLQTSAANLDQAERLLAQADYLDSLCNPALGPCFFIEGTPTPLAQASPTPNNPAVAGGPRTPRSNPPENPYNPIRTGSNTGGSSGSESNSGGSGSGSGSGLMSGSGEKLAMVDPSQRDGLAHGPDGGGSNSQGYHGGGSGGGSGGSGGGGYGSSGGVTSDGSGQAQELNLNGNAGALNPMLGSDAEDYFERVGKNDSLFQVVQRRYQSVAHSLKR